MTENDIRLNKLAGKALDDIYVYGKIEFKMLREDWDEIKQGLKEAIDIKTGGIHNNMLPYMRLNKIIEEYEKSGLIL